MHACADQRLPRGQRLALTSPLPGSSLGFSALPEDEDSPVPPPGHRSGSGRQVHVVPAEDPSPSLSSLPEAAGRVGRDSSAASGPPAETQSAR